VNHVADGKFRSPSSSLIIAKNGRWRNFEGTSVHAGGDVTTYAYRDIKAGEQLYLSYNECDDTDCEGIFRYYGTQEILVDYGFVEDFPQRWIWNEGIPFMEQMSEPLIIEVDRVEKPDPYDPSLTTLQYEVTWHTELRLTLDIQNFITSQVNRMEKLESDILAATEALESSHEQYTIRNYYVSLKRALKLAMLSSYDEAIDKRAVDGEDSDRHNDTEALDSSNEQYTIQAFYMSLKRALKHVMWASYDEAIDNLAVVDGEHRDRHYDTLDERALFGKIETTHPPTCNPIHELGTAGDYKSHSTVVSHYQHIEFLHGEEETSLVLNELVLWRHDTLVDIGDWIPARVSGHYNNLTYDIRTESHRVARSVRRGLLRRLDFDANAHPLLDVAANVLVQIVEMECWQQGTVLSRLEDGTSHNVRLYTGKELAVKNIGQLMPLMETKDENDLPKVSMITFSNAFKDSLKSMIPEEDFASLTLYEHAILKGMTMTAFWKGGNAVLVWSGERRVDINLFLNQGDEKAESKFYDSFVDKLPFMETLARDRQPRGFGGVVNFGNELVDEKTPIWWHGGDKADS
jgi:hypothetical protein